MTREVEETGQLLGSTSSMTRVGESATRLAKLIEEGVNHSIDGRETLSWRVLQEQ